MPIALLAAALGGWMLAGRALAPVDTMVAAARRIGAEDLSLRLIGDDRDDELGRLAGVLNEMLARLERSFVAARRFSADAAHELRTPLTILKGEIEVALHVTPLEPREQATLASCLEEVNRLAALIEDLLFLARADADAVSLPGELVDLWTLVADARLGLEAIAEPAGVGLIFEPPETPVRVRGSAPLLFRVLFNLGENAIKYGGTGCTVTIGVKAEGTAAVATVRDTGAGIAAAEHERIFERFYRADPARERGGTGLGLPLARSIVRLHGGEITVESAPGRGTCFRVRLPATQAA
jgi:heavy metal sensor kinase